MTAISSNGLQSFDRFTRRAMDLVAKWVETATAIDQKQDRQRQAVLTEVSDLLFRAVFVNLKILLLKPTDNTRGLLFEHQRIDSH